MRNHTILSAVFIAALTGCSSNEETQVTHQPFPFDYGNKMITAPTIEHIISFDEGSSTLTEVAKDALKPHIKHLIANPWSSVRLQGSASKSGDIALNYEIGLKRATAVKDQLLAEGVDESQVSISSVGKIDVLEFPSRTVVLSY